MDIMVSLVPVSELNWLGAGKIYFFLIFRFFLVSSLVFH